MGQLSTSTDISLSSSFGISISSVSTDGSQQPEHFELILHALHTYFAHVSQLITFSALTAKFPILYILLQKIMIIYIFSTKKELIRYLQNNIDQIEYVILK